MCMRLIYGICVCAHSDDLLRPMYCWPRRWQYTVCVCVCVEYRAYVHAFDIRYYVYVRIPVPGPAQCTAGRGGGNIRDIVLYILILKHPIRTNSIYTVHYLFHLQIYFCTHTQHLYLYFFPNLLLHAHPASALYITYTSIQIYFYILTSPSCPNVPLYTKCTFIY